MPGPHISESRLCAGCHTVLVHALDGAGVASGPEIVEQTTYLEWRNSISQDETAGDLRARSCQGCHMPGAGSPMPYATRPADSVAHPEYRLHTLVGGNAYML